MEAGEIARSAAARHKDDDDFVQAGNLYRDVMSTIDRHHLVGNIVGHMGDGVERQVQERAVALWRRVWPRIWEHESPGASGSSSEPSFRRGDRAGRNRRPDTGI